MRKLQLGLLTGIGILLGLTGWAQPSVQRMRDRLQQQSPGLIADYMLNMPFREQASVRFQKGREFSMNSAEQWLQNNLELRPAMDALESRSMPVSYGNYEVKRLQQFFKGIPVEHGVINITAKSGLVQLMQLEFYPVKPDFRTTPVLSLQEAKSRAYQALPAQQYVEENDQVRLLSGKLVILGDVYRDNIPTLAYRFFVIADDPHDEALVYIDATDGRVLLTDHRICHANEPGTADTRYSGHQTIMAFKDVSLPAGQQFILAQIRNGYTIRTQNMNYKKHTNANVLASIDFSDNDNNWTKAEYGDSATLPVGQYLHNAALEAHFNMSLVSDYWKEVHNRSSFDNQGSNIFNMIHTLDKNNGWLNNAYWSGGYKMMFYGDGNGTPAYAPLVSIDIIGHELGHAITEYTAGLVYRWESGALNEGFSDIWGACANNYLKFKYPAIPGDKRDWRIGEESYNCIGVDSNRGLRDMGNPFKFGQPALYKGTNWKAASYTDCPTPIGDGNDPNYNDQCGVHTNSGVLNKWFYLITNGETGTNGFGYNYSVVGLGFRKTDSLAYLTELNLTPNAGYKTARNVSVNAAITLWGDFAEAQIVRQAWLAVGVDTTVFNMSNTAAFTTNSFSSIVVGKHGTIWAGTTTNASSTSDGLYRYNGTKWEKASVLTNNAIAQMATDKNGGLWIAQYGRTGAQAITGGVNYFPDTAFSANTFYSVSNGVVSRNVRSILVDTFRMNGSNPAIWSASMAQITAGVSATGGVSYGLNGTGNAFTKITVGVEQTSTSGGTQTIGGGKNEIWAFSSLNFNSRSQIIRYNPLTRDTLGFYDNSNVPLLPTSFSAKSIYFDAAGRKWLGMLSDGLIILDTNGTWHSITPTIYDPVVPTGTIVNNNAITGDKFGNVYIGTNMGLIFYNHGDIDDISSYRRYTTANGLPSNNIRSIAVDTIHYKLLLATDNGIVFFDQICNGWEECQNQVPGLMAEVSTISAGNWSNPAIWSTNKVPDYHSLVTIKHAVQVDINGKCYQLNQKPGGSITIQTGMNLNIAQGAEQPDPTNETH